MGRPGTAVLLLLLVVVSGAPPGDSLEGTAVLFDCSERTVTGHNGTGLGNVGRLVVALRVDNRNGQVGCPAEVRVVGASQIGEGTSEVSYEGQTTDACTAPAGGRCFALIDLSWTFCGDAAGVRWDLEVRSGETLLWSGHVDALTLPAPCDAPL